MEHTDSTLEFDRQPMLVGERIVLRPLHADDFASLYAVASDPLMWELHPAKDRYQEEIFRAFFRDALESGGALIACDATDGQVIGTSRFHGYDPARSLIEIGWTFLARRYWGGTYNREMKQLMLRHAFQFVQSVIFVVDAHNYRSQRAVEKIGGVSTETRTDATGREDVIYRLTETTYIP